MENILSRLLGKQIEADCNLENDKLGLLYWSKRNNWWSGNYNGYSFTIEREKFRRSPSIELLEYAHSIMAYPEILESTLRLEKEQWLLQKSLSQEQIEEISSLKIAELGFYRYKRSSNRIFVELLPDSKRSWRIEYIERQCMGLGFDS